MADIAQVATLGVTIDGTQAAAGAQQVKAALADLATQGATTANVFLDTAARAQDFARAGASAAQVAQMTGVSMADARTAVQAFRGSVAQTTDDMFLLKAAQEQLAFAGVNVAASVEKSGGFMAQLAGHAGNAAVGMSYLRRELVSSAAVMTGTNPMLDRMLYTLTALSGPGMGEIAIGLIAMTAGLGLAYKAWEKLNEGVTAAQKTLDAFNKSSEATAAHAKELTEFNFATMGGSESFGTAGATQAIQKLMDAQAAAETLATHMATVMNFGNPFSKFGGGVSGAGAEIRDIAQAFGNETMAADAAHAALLKIAAANKDNDYARQALELDKLVTSFMAATPAIRAFNAQLEHKKALEDETTAKYGAGPVAMLGAGPSQAAALLHAAQTGGKDAVQQVKDQTEAAKLATDAWNKWTTSTNGLYLANVTLDEALAHHLTIAQQLMAAAKQQVADGERAKKVLDDQAKAEKDAAKNVSDLNAFMAARVKDYEKAQESNQKFNDSVTANIAKMKAETDALNAQISVVGAARDVQDAMTVSLAGQAAVEKLLADAKVKDKTATEDQINATRQQAEALERANLTLKESEKAQRDLAAAQKHAAAEAAAQAKQQAEDLARSINATMTSLFGQITASGKNEWAKMLDSFAKSFEQLAARLAAQNLGRAILGSLGSGSFTSAIPAGALGPGDAGEVIGGGLSAAALAGTATAFVGIMGMIGSSILQTSQENAAAVAQFKTATVAWQEAFQKFIASFTATTFESQGMSLSDKFQSQIQSAIANAAAAIAGSPAAKFGASGVGLFGKTSVSLPAGLSTDPANLAATIAAVQALQGHGKNVAQDNELRILLQQLEQLDAAYKKQAAALAAQQAAEQAAFNQTLATRTLTAQADAAAAAGNQTLAQSLKDQAAVATLAAQQQAELTAAQKQGYDAATIAALEKVQALEMAALKAQQEAAAAAKAFADQQTGQTLQARLLAATGDTAAANALSLQIAQAKEYQDAVNAGWSAANLAALKFTQQAEAAKAAADAAAAAQQASLNQLTQQFKVFGTTAQDQLNAISSLYGFSGMTLAQVQALYTQYQPGQTLTPAQLQQNANIAQWVQAYQAAMGAGGLAGTAAQAGATSATTAVSAVVTDRTALMMVDLDRARNTLLDKIEQNTRKGGAGGVVFYNTFQFGQNFTQQAANAIVDELERELDKALGMKLNLQHIYTGSVAR